MRLPNLAKGRLAVILLAAVLLPAAYASAAGGGHVYTGHEKTGIGSDKFTLSGSRGKLKSFTLKIPVGCGGDGSGVTVGGGEKTVKSQGATKLGHGKFSVTQTGSTLMPPLNSSNGTYDLTVTGKLSDKSHKLDGRLRYVIKQPGHYCTAAASASGKIESYPYTTTES